MPGKVEQPMQARHHARSASLLVFLTLALLLSLMPAQPADATLSSWRCSLDGCKYAQARVDYTMNSPNHSTTNRLDTRGATASGTCDSSNDISQWRIEQATVRGGSGAIIWSTGNSTYRTNCSITSSTALRQYYPGVSASGSQARAVWRHNAACCGAFYPTVTISY